MLGAVGELVLTDALLQIQPVARGAVVGSIRYNFPFAMVVGFYLAAAQVAGSYFGFPIDIQMYNRIFFVFLPFLLFMTMAGATLLLLYRDRPTRPLAHLFQVVKSGRWQIFTRLVFAIPPLILIPPFFSSFTSVKMGISTIVPFYADPFLISADRLLHGRDVWLILQPLLGYPKLTATIDFLYGLWHWITMSTLIYAIFMRSDDGLRSRYLFALACTWVLLGSLVATLFSSVGPCFYETFYGNKIFAAHTLYIESAAPLSLLASSYATQQVLIAGFYDTGIDPVGGGISAFPSLHVAIAFLNVLFVWHLHRIWRWLAMAFLGCVLVGSVHLGWHYAVDGYVSIIMVALIWWASGCVVRAIRPTS